ncbi:thiamine phosphate synthase [Jannaschia donghaensis]|uniref:Thiamine-phosphate synthase n=1 Tax=Jannaschia donghaensis TaxID=420998 RepID=A0A0M6YPR4_9RHOB|nr:thiamine phosphate synthase [Jannaschia donghaensis]CTQ51247.1 Thiamine-phosphate synthase [Jannaschia donghaensis]
MIPRLCFITDATAALSIVDQAEAAVRGGAGWVQLRHKTLDDVAFTALARELTERIVPLGARLIVNDRVEVAPTVGAHGLHVGQTDGDPRAIRARIGPDAVLGLSVEHHAQIAAIPPGCVDYLGVGPVRATRSKADHATPLGFDQLARIVRDTDLPCIAIGGLTAVDAPALRTAGCAGMAVVSAVSRASDPEAAARAIVDQWSRA